VSNRRRARTCLTAALAATVLATAPNATARSVKLNVGLTPEHLGAGTTIAFTVAINYPASERPAPLTNVNLLYPANFGLITSGLGLASCSRAQLEAKRACPPDSLMGYGTALAVVSFGPDLFSETAEITTWMAPIEEGHLGLLFLAQAHTPVQTEIIFTSSILQAKPPFGGSLTTTVPLVGTLPGAGDIAVTRLHTTLGPMNITYYQQFHGKRTAYHPSGIRLPHNCPHNGFPFAVELIFQNGSHANTTTSVPCPQRHTRLR
jgi:hypothetical protein